MTITPKDFIGIEAAGDGWFGVGEIESDVADAFDELIQRQRALQHLTARVRPPVAVSERAAALLAEVDALLRPFEAARDRHLAGRLLERPGRGQAMVPDYEIDRFEDNVVSGRITFGSFHLGGGGAVHGGSIPLFFDEVMGWLAAYQGDRTRTAFLHVNFRNPTMVGHPLTFTVRIERDEGRKIFVAGELHDGETLLADLEGLWVRLRPGQP
jgi:acyl-coenzyme A thioesterase PaaI-like protein